MSLSVALLIFDFFLAQLAMLPYGRDSNGTKLLGNLLTKPSAFYCIPIVLCNLISVKNIVIIIIIIIIVLL